MTRKNKRGHGLDLTIDRNLLISRSLRMLYWCTLYDVTQRMVLQLQDGWRSREIRLVVIRQRRYTLIILVYKPSWGRLFKTWVAL